MILLLDIGNTHTHVGLADTQRVRRQTDIPTRGWFSGEAEKQLAKFCGKNLPEGAVLCSVVPKATPLIQRFLKARWQIQATELGPRTVCHIGIDYPKPRSIGPDRLASAIGAKFHHGAPVIVVDFGTAVTFDVVDRRGKYIGGVITPGLSAMTDYLHEKTALLPRIKIRPVSHAVGKSTKEAMLIGAVHGYRGLVRELIKEQKKTLGATRLPVVATGGYASLIADGLPEITAVEPNLTLEGLRLVWEGRKNS